MSRKMLVVDMETTGLDPRRHGVVSLAAIVLDGGVEVDRRFFIVNDPFASWDDDEAASIHGLKLEVVSEVGVLPATVVDGITRMLRRFGMTEKVTLVSHGATFDSGFLRRLWGLGGGNYEAQFSHRMLCTHAAALFLAHAGALDLGEDGSAGLDNLSRIFGLEERGAIHDSMDDAERCKEVLARLVRIVRPQLYADPTHE